MNWAVVPRRPRLKAWPSLRVRCSGGRAEMTFYFTTKHTKLTEILNQEIRNRGKSRELLRYGLKIAHRSLPLVALAGFNFFVGDPFLRSCFPYLESDSC